MPCSTWRRAATWCWARCAIPAGLPLDYLQVDEGWFSLWTPSSAIRMYSAGGNLTPGSQLADSNWNGLTPTAGLTGIHFTYPSIFTAAAPSGSIYSRPRAA